jgi:hypothetical protein
VWNKACGDLRRIFEDKKMWHTVKQRKFECAQRLRDSKKFVDEKGCLSSMERIF